MCYEKAESCIIDDTSISPNYIKDISTAGSEILVSIILSEEDLAVISSEALVTFFAYKQILNSLISIRRFHSVCCLYRFFLNECPISK